MRANRSYSLSERLTRLTWWLIMRLLRKGFAKNFNHKIAKHLRPAHAEHFLKRGKSQNAFARKHGLAATRFALGVIKIALLCAFFYMLAFWLYQNGYFTAPGSPKRDI